MSFHSHLLLSILLWSRHTHASPAPQSAPAAPSFIFPGDAPFTVPTDALAASLTCPNGNPTAKSPPVLLVHGTATTGAESWGEGYVPALKASGFTACYVTIPNRSMGDMQINAEYVAYSLHHISQLAGGLPTAVVAHSQGGPNTQWALQFFPSTRAVTRAFIALSPDFAGIELLHSDSLFSDICATGLCQAALWQQGVGSQYYRALHAGDFRALVPTTSIWSQFDGVVAPFAANARLPGATVLAVQSLCPLRPEYHVTMTISAAVWAIALDALRHGGTADLGRVLPTALGSCLRVAAKNMNSNIAKDLGSLFTNLIDGFLLATPRLRGEPVLQPYAQLALGG